MKKMFFLFLALFLFSSQIHAASRTEIILDVSGSMNKMLGSEKRIEAARKSIATALAGIPDDAVVSLRLYSHRISPRDKAASCKDTELVVPFGPVNKPLIQTIVNTVQPLGETPIAYSLEQAANDFGAAQDEQAVIILVSDGEESCGGDPVATAKALVARGFKVKIHTIGIDVDAVARGQLEGISNATGGMYKDARDATSLANSLQELTRDALIVKKTQATYGDAIRGGDSYETAVPLTLGKLYHLDHHQLKNQFDYFYIDVKAGASVMATTETGEDGVTINTAINQAQVHKGFPYAGIALHSPLRQEIKREEIIGGANDRKTIQYPVPSDGAGRYYILIGSTYDNQNKDHRFKVEVEDISDANSGVDAGDTEAAALAIQPGQYEKNSLSPGDKVDYYKLIPQAGAAYEIKARSLNPEVSVEITLSDADGVQIAAVHSPNGGAAAKFDNVSFSKPGAVFIKVNTYYASGYGLIPYSFSIATAGTSANVGNSLTTAPVLNGTNPNVPAPSPSSNITQNSSQVLGVKAVLLQMSWIEKIKWVVMYVLCPSFAVFLFGLLFGYIWGRRSGKRKAIAQMQKAQVQAQKAATTAPVNNVPPK